MRFPRYPLLSLAFVAALVNAAHAQTTTAASVDSFGNQSPGSAGGFGGTAISADGRHVVFDSNAVLAPNWPGLYDHDRLTGATITVAPWLSFAPSMSADGRFVAFESLSALAPTDTNGAVDVYIWDRTSGTYEAINVAPDGSLPPAPFVSSAPSMSADGRFVAFTSNSDGLSPVDDFTGSDVFLRDRSTGTTIAVSTGGIGGSGSTISSSGDWVAFSSILDGASGRFRLWNRQTGNTEVIDPAVPTPGHAGPTGVSDDGSVIVFGLAEEVYIRNRANGSTERISTPANGPVFGGGYRGRLTPDGRFVTFQGRDGPVYLVDRVLGTSECVSRSWTGENVSGERHSTTPDGRFTAFRGWSPNIVPNQTNPEPGIFLRDRHAVSEVVSFCHGDGSASACPCSNFVPSGTVSGCTNSTGVGASLSASGVASIAADSVLLTTTGMPNSVSLYVRGTSRVNGGSGTAFGDGLRCVAGALVRLGTSAVIGGASTFPKAGASLSNYGALAGVAQQYQTWYRNPAPAFCSPGTFNLSNGLTVLWAP